ncbi:hypothetical protein RJK59_004266 [Salmonella enterica]|nr:hypothetical protein [Salmonella enterica subsp. enterica]ELC5052863.1 hypothetical protein [Salmonella enterica]
MKELTLSEMIAVNGAGADVELKPLPCTEAPTTNDAPFVHGKPGYKENDVPGGLIYIDGVK